MSLIVDKRVIKYANRVKDLNRQYEMNNNCDLDNGVYNKFVNQSSSSEEDQDEDSMLSGGAVAPQGQVRMFDSYNDNEEEEQNSLVTSMNGEAMPQRRIAPQAPLVS